MLYAGKIGETNDEEEHIYIMAKDCVNNVDLPKVVKNGKIITNEVEDENGEKKYVEVGPMMGNNSYAAYFCDYSANNGLRPYYPLRSNEITNEALKELNGKYYKYLNENGNPNGPVSMFAAAYMLDTVTWGNYVGKHGVYAIGGPSIELWLNSFNIYANDNYLCDITGINGYKIGHGDTEAVNSSLNIDNALDTTDKDLVYDCNKNYWLCSPSGNGSWFLGKAQIYNKKMVLGTFGNANSGISSWANCGFRPVICLSSDVTLEKVVDETGKIKLKIVD